MAISPVINGNFDHWTHRDFADIGDVLPATATGGYWSDRFGHRGSTSKVSPERRQFAAGERPGSRYYHRTTVTTLGPGGSSLVAIDIHRADTFAGQVSTLFFDFRADQPCNIVQQWQRTYGAGGSDADNLTPTTIAVTPTWTTYKLLVTLPSVAGKVIGPHDDDYVTPIWWYEGNYLPNRSGVFDIARVGWLPGDLTGHPDPFSLMDTSQDRERVRAYSRMGEGEENLFDGIVQAGQNCWSAVSFGTPLRAVPVMTLKSRGQLAFPPSGLAQATRYGFNEHRQAFASLTSPQPGYFWSRWLADAEFPYTP